MQEYFLNPTSPFSRSCEALVPGVLDYFQERGRTAVELALRRLLEFFRAHGLRVFYTTVASELADGQDLMPIFRQRNAAAQEQIGAAAILARTDPWARIVSALEPRPHEIVLNKTTYGTFNSTGLDHTLRFLGIDTLVIGGVVTNVCVETTARDAADMGYQVILVDDACAAIGRPSDARELLGQRDEGARIVGARKPLLVGGQTAHVVHLEKKLPRAEGVASILPGQL
jgi:biuret amidohydrolase